MCVCLDECVCDSRSLSGKVGFGWGDDGGGVTCVPSPHHGECVVVIFPPPFSSVARFSTCDRNLPL